MAREDREAGMWDGSEGRKGPPRLNLMTIPATVGQSLCVVRLAKPWAKGGGCATVSGAQAVYCILSFVLPRTIAFFTDVSRLEPRG
jgi:hypothetical protein